MRVKPVKAYKKKWSAGKSQQPVGLQDDLWSYRIGTANATLRQDRGRSAVPPCDKELTMPAFPPIHIGDPMRHKALTVFPLFTQTNGIADYLLSAEALSTGTVTAEDW